MRLLVVRHANAGHRTAWDDDIDDFRPLTGKGRKQAQGIADALADAGIDRLVSSPSVRCVQTLEPLSTRLGMKVRTDRRLAEGAGGDAALELAAELRARGSTAVLCSHGDVIPEMLRTLQANGTRFRDPLLWPKGCTWIVTEDDGYWSKARYVPPPER
jgi:broad specificity phosphatase PhoE